jgi:hypothetical protein
MKMYDGEPRQQIRLERRYPMHRHGQNISIARADPVFQRDVLDGLASRPRMIPARWFYDRAGSELFEAIKPAAGPRSLSGKITRISSQ